MLENAQLGLIFEPDRDGVFANLSREEQRRIEREFMAQVKSVVAEATVRDWLAPTQAMLGVDLDSGTRQSFDPGDESMTRANLVRFFKVVLEGAGTQSPGVRLALDVEGQIAPICKVKVDGTHVDGVNCPLALIATSGQSQPSPWILKSTTSAGVPVTTQVRLELQYLAPDPT